MAVGLSLCGCAELQPAALSRKPQLIPAPTLQPDYPPSLFHKGLQGDVVVEYGVSEKGRVTDVKVLTSAPDGEFDQAVLKALKRWQFNLPSDWKDQSTTFRDKAEVIFVIDDCADHRQNKPAMQTLIVCASLTRPAR